MPTLVLRGLDPALVAAVKREAARQNLTVREMTIRLLWAGLQLPLQIVIGRLARLAPLLVQPGIDLTVDLLRA